MMYISDIITKILGDNDRPDVIKILGVSSAVLSKWKHENNEHKPRLSVAVKIFGNYGFTAYPYSSEALQREWELL